MSRTRRIATRYCPLFVLTKRLRSTSSAVKPLNNFKPEERLFQLRRNIRSLLLDFRASAADPASKSVNQMGKQWKHKQREYRHLDASEQHDRDEDRDTDSCAESCLPLSQRHIARSEHHL